MRTGRLIKHSDGSSQRLWWETIPNTDRVKVTIVSYGKDGYYSAIRSHSGNDYPLDYIEQLLDFAIERGSKVITIN